MDKQAAIESAAFINGRRAGLGLVPASLNQYAPGTAEHLQWQQGHYSATFTERPHCIAPNHACPLAEGQCQSSCYLADCEPKQASSLSVPRASKLDPETNWPFAYRDAA